ncbi:FAD/NAD(P)-binding domain-containing protein [Aaosphaeria arxii CBS 175.79]|uniref:FAD/NAD(P)-binding domain-containing protein n=1 Tax=Aaosphaeria arxii CBS 175.79 TaxID=1450172 RepID=A0A6A5X7E5_9PLEO|nr:FAD/NAD(P)-binding domain-containing protein [Aaosphaeria arxii CBS 175.79]KAF2008868.1 FAD/NAD(P)-binding domain-containing protein [Aaosphaeria arxii CBS 175.79]
MIDTNATRKYGSYPLYDRTQRAIHVVIAGAGPSGIALAIELKKIANVTFQIYEKNQDVGGTWFENRYPGAACDVASHAYQYTFECKKDWTRHFAPAEEIGDYFISVARKYGLYEHIRFDSQITGAVWNEDEAIWSIEVLQKTPVEPTQVQADVFVNAGGILNDWKWPDIMGLSKFAGKLLHTASWDHSFDWADKNIAVIGSGATSIQVVPQMQPKARKLEVFVRSPTYIIPRVGFGVESSTFNAPYLQDEVSRFQNDPKYYKVFRKKVEQQMNENFMGSVKNSQAQRDGRKWAEGLMRDSLQSKELQDKLIPDWELGCRRLTPGQPYLHAVQQPNVHVERTPITRVTPEGIETTDGVLHNFDAIVCATGFSASFSARFDIVGSGNQNLRQLWTKGAPEAYLGLAISGFPNYFVMLGPNCPIANGSLVPCIEYGAKYIAQVLKKMQTDQIRKLDVKKKMQDAFNDYTQNVHQDLVWSGSCHSWYKDSQSGRVTAVWPGSSIHYMEMIDTPRWEDFDIDYVNENPFAFMGNGVSKREALGKDLTFYLDSMPED